MFRAFLTRLGEHVAPPRFLLFAVALATGLAVLVPVIGWAHGMTFPTSDVAISHDGIGQTVIGPCLAAFVFNIGVLAFTINVLGSSG